MDNPKTDLWIQRLFLSLLILLLCITPVIIWYFTQDRLPREIRIASGAPGGLYYKFSLLLADRLERRTQHPSQALESNGSLNNQELINTQRAELGVMQLDTWNGPDILALAPVFEEVVHIVVRKSAGIDTISTLRGKAVALGKEGSGMRKTALQLLAYYNLTPKELKSTEHYFMDLAQQPELDAAIVTTGLLNPDLEQLLRSGEYRILPIENAPAMVLHYPHYKLTEIPRGYFSAIPPVPQENITTYATPAILGIRPDASEALVTEVLDALYESDMRNEISSFIPKHEAANWTFIKRHPATEAYYNPYEGLGVLANFVESLAGIKELLFALGAGIYMLWSWRRRRHRAQVAEIIAKQKEHLDKFLEQTIEIEKAQMKTEAPDELKKYLDKITLIKLTAIRELTHEELRGDRLFSIFLTQCGHLTQKIHAKIIHASSQSKNP